MAHDAPCWTAAAAVEALRWRRFDEAWFAFDPRSGQTHFLNHTAFSVLQLLGGRPHTLEALETAFRTAHAAQPDPELQDVLEDTLRVMDALGLARPLP
jgi:PqqD family protein of HPr-rel-A system